MVGVLPGERQLRLVIQSVAARGKASPQYRVVVYPEPMGFHGPLIFFSREELLTRLSSAMPEFDANLVREPGGEARIVFAGMVNMTDAQFGRLCGV